jgi:cation diffusion facilitator CzcD-associated flavoprotein CzcO
MTNLASLEHAITRDLDILGFPKTEWVDPFRAPDGHPALDCAVIGAGQIGLTIAAGLKRERVSRVVLFDAAPAGEEGPWRTFARMEMLRTPKDLTGVELGVPSLSVRAWWEAQWGVQSWAEMFRIPRTKWMDYLVWFRRVMGLEVRNEWRLTAIVPVSDDLFRLEFATPAGAQSQFARTIVLATGAEGSGGHVIPADLAAAVPADCIRHCNDVFDFSVLRGQRVGILGAGASAFDAATAALEHGAAAAHLCFRRPSLPLENPRRWMENPGFLAHYGKLPDAQKWGYMHRLLSIGQPPPRPTLEKALSKPGFSLHPATPWEHVVWNGSAIEVSGGGQLFTFDFLIAATGIAVDLAMRPEFDGVRDQIALWADRYTPPPGLEDPRLQAFFYLGAHGELQEKHPGAAPWLRRIFTVSRAATLSLGPVAASNSALKYIAPLLVRGVTEVLFLDQADAAWQAFVSRDHAEITDPLRQGNADVR